MSTQVCKNNLPFLDVIPDLDSILISHCHVLKRRRRLNLSISETLAFLVGMDSSDPPLFVSTLEN